MRAQGQWGQGGNTFAREGFAQRHAADSRARPSPPPGGRGRARHGVQRMSGNLAGGELLVVLHCAGARSGPRTPRAHAGQQAQGFCSPGRAQRGAATPPTPSLLERCGQSALAPPLPQAAAATQIGGLPACTDPSGDCWLELDHGLQAKGLFWVHAPNSLLREWCEERGARSPTWAGGATRCVVLLILT